MIRKSKYLFILIVTTMFIITLTSPAFAQNVWIDMEQVDSPYYGREYTREHYTRFWVNPNGYHLGIAGADSIGAMYCSVFDKENDLTQGYTAVTTWDRTNNQSKHTLIEGNFLDPYGVAKDDSTDAYLVSPASYKQGGEMSPFSNQSGCKYDVGISKNTSGPNIPSYSTLKEPVAISQGPDHFQAGAYVNGKREYWKSSGPYGEANLTEKAASSFYYATRSTSADVIISFPYGIAVTGLRCTGTGTMVGDSDRWEAVITNGTPYKAKNVTLRAYKIEDGTIKQVNSKTVDIGPTGLNSSELANVKYNFSIPLSDKSYKVIVTANLNIKSGSTTVNGSTATKEPLNSEFGFGVNAGSKTPYDGEYEKAVTLNFYGHSGLDAYDDNWLDSTTMSGGAGGGGSDDGENNAPRNLYISSLGLYDRGGQPVGGTLKAGQSYVVRVGYKSTFNISGWAKLALYFKDSNGNMRQIGDTTHYKFAPGGTFEKEYLWGVSSYEGTVIAVINLDWNGGNSFTNLKFEGQTELTYDDNKKELGTAASESERTVPTAGESSSPLYYHPLKEEWVPVYKTVKEKVWVPKVEKMRFIPADVKVKTILVSPPKNDK